MKHCLALSSCKESLEKGHFHPMSPFTNMPQILLTAPKIVETLAALQRRNVASRRSCLWEDNFIWTDSHQCYLLTTWSSHFSGFFRISQSLERYCTNWLLKINPMSCSQDLAWNWKTVQRKLIKTWPEGSNRNRHFKWNQYNINSTRARMYCLFFLFFHNWISKATQITGMYNMINKYLWTKWANFSSFTIYWTSTPCWFWRWI